MPEDTASAAPKRQRKRQQEENLVRSYIAKIVKEKESGITGDALNMLQRIIMGQLHDLAGVVNVAIAPSRSMKTISDLDIKVATEILFGTKGAEACARCCAYVDARLAQYANPKVKGQKSAMAGLVLPVTSLIKKFMSLVNPYVDAKKKILTHRKKDSAGVALAAVLEFVTREIVDRAVEKSKAEKRNRVIPTHISATVEQEEWLRHLLRAYVMQGALTFAPPVPKASKPKAAKASKPKAAKAAKATKAGKPKAAKTKPAKSDD